MNKTKIWAFGIAIVMVLMMLTTVLGIATEVKLWAGQNIDVGTVTVSNSGTHLFVKYVTTDGWVLNETHLAVVVNTSFGDIPQNKAGNPIPGKFKYKNDHNSSTTSYTYEIPLDWNVDETLFVAAHAVVQLLDGNKVVQEEETAWGEGDDFDGKNWAMYFNYTVQQGLM